MNIEPGHLWENGYAESFRSEPRDECLNEEGFVDRSPHPGRRRVVVTPLQRGATSFGTDQWLTASGPRTHILGGADFRGGAQLLTSKLRPPRLRDRHIDRPRLLMALDAVLEDTVVLVVAPAGYGKTSLLAQWAAQCTEPVAWLSLASSENDIVSFISYLIGAIHSVDPSLTCLDERDPHRNAVSPSHLGTILLNDLTNAAVPFSLVLDDYHVIEDPAIHSLVLELIDHLPESVHLIISSRIEPPFPLARLRVNRNLTVVGIEELRFTPSETAAFFARQGVELQERDVATLQERTSGWIAGLQMAALNLAEGMTSDEVFLQRMKASSRLLQDFLLEEVLERQPADVQAFLLRTALFDRFSADLYQAITGQPAAQLLERVLRANLFIDILDEQATWFHYHDLFQAFLRSRAAVNLDAADRFAIFRAASDWFEQQTMTADAISAAITGQDWQRAANLIRPIVDEAMQREDLGQLVTWFRALPTELLNADPNLCTWHAWCLVRMGNLIEARPAIALAERLAESTGDVFALTSATIADAQRSQLAQDPKTLMRQVEQSVDLVDQLMRQVEQGVDPADQSGAELTLDDGATPGSALRLPRPRREMLSAPQVQRAAALRLLGHAAEAERALNVAREMARSQDTPYQYQAATVELGNVLVQQGRLSEACDYLRDAIASTTIYPSDQRFAMLLLAEVDLEGNQLDDAQRLLNASRESLERSGVRTWSPHLHFLQAQVAWARGEAEAAMESARTAVRAAAECGNERVVQEADAFIAQIQLSQGKVGPALQWAYDSHLAADDAPDYIRLREYLVYARVLMAQGESEDAINLLERMLTAADADGRVADVIAILVILAMGYQELFELENAVAALDRALYLTESGGYLRTFTKEGPPMVRLLKVAQRRGVAAARIQRLLTTMGEPPAETSTLYHQELVEGITPREMEVLRLIAVGLCNREVADELYISVATVKRHVTNLYGKLGVSTRTAAVQKARTLGLLTRPPVPVAGDGAGPTSLP